MDSVHLRFRQVHLDFHTSAICEDVGADFDPQVFAETVKMGHVNSMTIFAKCHHGFSYYPTTVGTMHPHLSFDLMPPLGEHRIGSYPALYRLRAPGQRLFYDRLMEVLRTPPEAYAADLEAHFIRHLRPFVI